MRLVRLWECIIAKLQSSLSTQGWETWSPWEYPCVRLWDQNVGQWDWGTAHQNVGLQRLRLWSFNTTSRDPWDHKTKRQWDWEIPLHFPAWPPSFLTEQNSCVRESLMVIISVLGNYSDLNLICCVHQSVAVFSSFRQTVLLQHACFSTQQAPALATAPSVKSSLSLAQFLVGRLDPTWSL